MRLKVDHLPSAQQERSELVVSTLAAATKPPLPKSGACHDWLLTSLVSEAPEVGAGGFSGVTLSFRLASRQGKPFP